jgi:hypothetical protein
LVPNETLSSVWAAAGAGVITRANAKKAGKKAGKAAINVRAQSACAMIGLSRRFWPYVIV